MAPRAEISSDRCAEAVCCTRVGQHVGGRVRAHVPSDSNALFVKSMRVAPSMNTWSVTAANIIARLSERAPAAERGGEHPLGRVRRAGLDEAPVPVARAVPTSTLDRCANGAIGKRGA